jgi:dTDP-4-amino-4,6-dideoxygalactose transaminase
MPEFHAEPQIPGADRVTRYLSCFLVDEKRVGITAAELIRTLEAGNVEARPVWRPMHMQTLYHGAEVVGGEVAEDLHRHGVCLPSSSSLGLDEQEHVIRCVRAASGFGGF